MDNDVPTIRRIRPPKWLTARRAVALALVAVAWGALFTAQAVGLPAPWLDDVKLAVAILSVVVPIIAVANARAYTASVIQAYAAGRAVERGMRGDDDGPTGPHRIRRIA